MAARRKLLFDYDQLKVFCETNKPAFGSTDADCEIYEQQVDKKWKDFMTLYEGVMTADEGVHSAEVIKLAEEKFTSASSLYMGYKRCVNNMKPQKASTSRADETIRHDCTMAHTASSLKLPPCDTPPFDGGYAKWPAFRDIFWGVFGTHPDITAAQKLYHLRSKTRGEAYQIVKKFDLVDNNFQLAWDALKERYENPRILVTQQMKILFGLQAVNNENPKSLRHIQRSINDSLSIFKSYKIQTENWDPILIHHCSSKIPEETLRAWEDSLTDHRKLPTWKQMDEFLSKRAEMLETVSDMRRPIQVTSQKSQSFMAKTESKAQTSLCKKCNGDHSLRICESFKAMPVKERMSFVYANKICANCLSFNHFKTTCSSKKRCNQCGKFHHSLIHLQGQPKSTAANARENRSPRSDLPPSSEQPTHSNSRNSVESVQAHFSQNGNTTILPTALVAIEHSGELFTVRALLDAGSEKSFITRRIQQTLKLPVQTHHTKISGLGGTVVGSSNSQCIIKLKSKYSGFKIEVKTIVVSKLSHLLPSKRVSIENISDFKNLKLSDPQFYKPSPIDMIIGSDYLPLINLKGVRSNLENGLEARESQFGWYLSGPLPTTEINSFSTSVSSSPDVALHEQMKQFWEIEDVGDKPPNSEEDEICEEFFKQTTYRQPDGRYVVRLPFRKEFPDQVFLGPSRNAALAQYFRMEKTLEKNPDLKQQYGQVLQEYIDLGHTQEIKFFEASKEKHDSFFLPHHAVVKPESTTTKVRVVFNGSKKTKSGFSLNDVLYPGPILQADIVQIILGWRLYKYVFTGDIQKMYRQLIVHDDDRQFQLILFRPDQNGIVKTFQHNRVTFGINCAPFLALRTLRQLSEDCEQQTPLASKILLDEIYVDDVLSGGHTLDEAQSKQDQLTHALASAAFPFKKITSNNEVLLSRVAPEDLLNEEFLKFDDSSTVKTLGIRWNAMSDTFYYVVGPIEAMLSVTKRQILSVIARLFDPLGWLGPIVVLAKLLMQQLWELNTSWDEVVPPHIQIKWNSFRENLPSLQNLRIPRWTEFSPECTVQVHGFCDASERAYCGAVYLRVQHLDKISSHLLVAKTRVAPLKKTTIPKLELCAAVLLTDLFKNIMGSLPSEHELYLWTDSSIVLGWLQKSPHLLKTFVANRITKLLNFSENSHWKHVRTEDNPADLGTRGSLPQDLIQNPLWWHGPPWLQLPKTSWPRPRIFEPTDLEIKKVSTFHLTISDDIITRFSSFNRAIRVFSYVLRTRLKQKMRPRTLDLSTEEVTYTKNCLIRLSQQIFYQEEYECLTQMQAIKSKSNISALAPFLDQHGLMRVRGRLENSGLSYDERHPILMPEKSHLTKLFIEYTHRILCHAEYNIMLRAVRQGFYVTRLKNCIRKCIRDCKACTIYKRKFQQQIMASLPAERATFSLPFTYTGVDFAGPFSLKSSTLRNAKLVKGYAAVFVCFSTRAVHLEVCSDLSTEGFLAAFTRFTSRRGLPKTMFSDNGRNFVGASNKLLQEHNEFLKSAEQCLVNKYGVNSFKWTFIPPYAPHMGGLWEAAVKSMKSHLKKLSTNLSFTFEEFSTLLTRIEAILNSRPLSPVSENPSELLPLTPGHFLRGAPLTAHPEAPEDSPSEKLSYLTRWKRLKTIQHIFSQRWKSEYITELQRRYKWKSTKNNLKENDFVIVKDDHLPPTEWKLGRIESVTRGKDNNVRVAKIRTQNGIIERPIVKLCILPSPQN